MHPDLCLSHQMLASLSNPGPALVSLHIGVLYLGLVEVRWIGLDRQPQRASQALRQQQQQRQRHRQGTYRSLGGAVRDREGNFGIENAVRS
jgi:hypothetical protein